MNAQKVAGMPRRLFVLVPLQAMSRVALACGFASNQLPEGEGPRPKLHETLLGALWYSNLMKKVFTENDIPAIAELVIQYIVKHKNSDGATIVALSGDLGAGKTTVTKEIAKILGIKDKVISPTFVLLKSYKLSKKEWRLFHHIDAYRFEKPEESNRIGWDTLVTDPGNVIFLEWPEQMGKLLPKKHITISLKHKSETKREITLK